MTEMMIIDRFEGDYAVIESNGEMIDILRTELPENAEEGDILEYVCGEYTVNKSAKKEIQAKMRSRLKELLKND